MNHTNYIGKLCTCPNAFLFAYPDMCIKQIITFDNDLDDYPAMQVRSVTSSEAAEFLVDYWSRMLSCKVNYLSPNEIFMVTDQKLIEDERILLGIIHGSSEKKGWILIGSAKGPGGDPDPVIGGGEIVILQ